MNKRIKGSLMLLLTALIWGNGFVAQSVGMDYIGPYTFLCVRGIIGGLFLIPCIFILKKFNYIKDESKNAKTLIKGGVLCGIVVCIANIFQQFGIVYTTVGKAGFITALYIIIVPLIGIIFKKKVDKNTYVSVLIAMAGLYLLCINESFTINKGDILSLICAFFFSIQILLVDSYSSFVDCVKLSCIQFLVSGIISPVPMFIFEHPEIKSILAAYIPLLYAGIMSFGIAYTLQIIGQKYLEASYASLLMSLESVFAVLGGWIILGQALSFKEVLGTILMFLSIILAQIPINILKRK